MSSKQPVKRNYKRGLSALASRRGGGDLTLRHVQVFHLLWNSTGNFREVANKIGVTQPAISAALSSLEELCGYELFHRGKGEHAKPTNAAITLAPYFETAFDRLQALTREIEHLRTNPDFGIPFRRVED